MAEESTSNVRSGDATFPQEDSQRREEEHTRRRGTGFMCCSRPNGDFTFVPSLLTTVAFIMSTYGHHSCRFINREVTVFGTEEDENETKVLQAFSLGLWAFMDPNNYGLCFTYPSNMQFDSYFKASRAMAPISSIFGGIVMVTFWFTSCMGMDKSCWRFYGFLLMVTVLFEGLTFLIFESEFCQKHDGFEFECKLSTGGNLCIAAMVLYFVAAISVCNTPNPRGLENDYITTVKTETIKPDGTRVIETRLVQAYP